MKTLNKVLITALFSLAFTSDVFSQQGIIVKDETDGALYGAHVSFKELGRQGNGLTVLTDINGKAIVPESFIASKNKIIVSVSYLGYETWSDTLSNPISAKIKLKPDKISLEGVVVTGQYSANNPEKSLHKVKIIDREQLDARGVVTLNEALKYETNLRMSQDNALGSSASLQGVSGENVKIMIDGVPVIGRQDGNIDLNQINMNNIERIEIVEGPLSVNYGTNALAGTINLISRKDQKENVVTGFNTYYESVGQYNIDGRVSLSKKAHRIGFSGGRNYFDGWSDGEEFTLIPKSEPADTSRIKQWNPKEQVFGDVQYQLTLKSNTIRLFANVFEEAILDRGSPRAPYYESAFDQHFKTFRYSIGADLSGTTSEKVSWKFLTSYNDYVRSKETYFKDLTNLEEQLSANSADHDTSRFESVMNRASVVLGRASARIRGEIGYDLFFETAYGKRIMEKTASMGDYALFGSVEWNVSPQLLIKPGLRIAHNTKYNAPPVPAINIKYAKGKSNLRASYAMGFRTPSLKELHFEFVDVNHNIHGNDDLGAETSHNFQLDAGYKMVTNQTVTNFELGLFYNNISNMISLAQQGGSATYSYINIGKYKTHGIEAGVNYTHNHWKNTVGFAYTGRSNQIDDSVMVNGMSYSPEMRLTILYEFKKLEGNLSFNYKYNGELPSYTVDEGGEIVETKIQAYQLLDLIGSKFFWSRRITLSFGVKNLLDVKNIQNSGPAGGVHSGGAGDVPISWGRSYFASLKFNMGWK